MMPDYLYRMMMESHGRANEASFSHPIKRFRPITRLEFDKIIPREVQCCISAASVYAHNGFNEQAEAQRRAGGYGGLT